MAGTRSVITSLWKVPDEATKELMLDFYRRLWVEKEAQAARAVGGEEEIARGQGRDGQVEVHDARTGAAWVLTGAPE